MIFSHLERYVSDNMDHFIFSSSDSLHVRTDDQIPSAFLFCFQMDMFYIEIFL